MTKWSDIVYGGIQGDVDRGLLGSKALYKVERHGHSGMAWKEEHDQVLLNSLTLFSVLVPLAVVTTTSITTAN